jgi:hypothetical protein
MDHPPVHELERLAPRSVRFFGEFPSSSETSLGPAPWLNVWPAVVALPLAFYVEEGIGR